MGAFGVPAGHPLATLLFAISLKAALEPLKRANALLPPAIAVCHLPFADDLNIFVPTSQLAPSAYTDTAAALAAAKYSLAHAKTEIVPVNINMPHVAAQAFQASMLAVGVPASAHVAGAIFNGVPYGTDAFITAAVTKKYKGAMLMLDSLTKYHDDKHHERPHLLEQLWYAARVSVTQQITHLLRAVDPGLTRLLSQALDHALTQFLGHLINYHPMQGSPEYADWQQRLFIAGTDGGFGITSAALSSDSSHLASAVAAISYITAKDAQAEKQAIALAAARAMLLALVPNAAAAVNAAAAPPPPYVRPPSICTVATAAASAYARLAPTCPLAATLNPANAHLLTHKQIKGAAGRIAAAQSGRAATALIDALPTGHARSVYRGGTGVGGSASVRRPFFGGHKSKWLMRDNGLENRDFAIAIRLRARLKILTRPAHMPVDAYVCDCNLQAAMEFRHIDEYGEHIHVCLHRRGDHSTTHDGIRDKLLHHYQRACANTSAVALPERHMSKEGFLPKGANVGPMLPNGGGHAPIVDHKSDITYFPDGPARSTNRAEIIDISVTHSNTDSSDQQRGVGGPGRTTGAAGILRYKSKIAGYVNNYHIDKTQVKPVIYESGGHINEQSRNHLQVVAHRVVLHTLNRKLSGDPIPTIHYATQIRRINEDLSAALQRGNARCISNYIDYSASLHSPLVAMC